MRVRCPSLAANLLEVLFFSGVVTLQNAICKHMCFYHSLTFSAIVNAGHSGKSKITVMSKATKEVVGLL